MYNFFNIFYVLKWKCTLFMSYMVNKYRYCLSSVTMRPLHVLAYKYSSHKLYMYTTPIII